MSAKDNNQNSMEDLKIQALFSQVRAADMEPSPYMKTRLLSHLRESQMQKKNVLFWKWISISSLVATMLLGWVSLSFYQRANKDGFVHESYVIQVDFNANDLQKVAKAEVVLPDDVHFVSSQNGIREEKRMKLPITLKTAGRGKLPFVVSSTAAGEKEITVRLLDENEKLVREQTMKFKFAKDNQKISL